MVTHSHLLLQDAEQSDEPDTPHEPLETQLDNISHLVLGDVLVVDDAFVRTPRLISRFSFILG